MSTPEARPAWWRVPLLPWLSLIRPGRAARLMAGAPWLTFLPVHFLYLALWPATIVFLAMWDDTHVWSPAVPTTMATEGGVITVWRPDPSATHRSFAEVWARWHAQGPIGPAERLFFVLTLVGLALWSLVAWLHLPTVHRGGSPAESYGRALRGLGCGWGPLLVATVLVGSGVVASNHYVRQMGMPSLWMMIPPFSILLAAHTLVIWIARAMSGVSRLSPIVELAPMCEGCGYNLMHVPAEGRCPECGMEAARSVGPGQIRTGWAWERASGAIRVMGWFEVNRWALLRAQEFYGQLELRRESPAVSWFAPIQFALMGLTTAMWAAGMLLLTEGSAELLRTEAAGLCLIVSIGWLGAWVAALLASWRVALIVLLAGFGLLGLLAGSGFKPTTPWGSFSVLMPTMLALGGIPLLAWLAHRVAGAVAATWWFARDELSDPRAARKVVAYESVFVWVPWLYGLSLSTSFFIKEDWLSDLLGRRWIAGLPPEMFVFFAGLAVLLAWWVWRFYIAGRAVRWANF